VEFWLGEVETRMRASVREQSLEAIAAYATDARTDWVLCWPAMVVLAVSGIYWSKGVEDGVAGGRMTAVLDKNTSDLMALTDLVRGQLTPMHRMTLGALITVDVHARDVVADLVACGLVDITDFEWVKQLRYYWRDGLFVDMVQVLPPCPPLFGFVRNVWCAGLLSRRDYATHAYPRERTPCGAAAPTPMPAPY
jgi:dynein heavy chain, axonemal